jgi:hypothetical protein
MMTRYYKSCRSRRWLLQKLLQLSKSLISRSMIDTFKSNNWCEQLDRLKHLLRCRIFISKLRMLLRHIALLSLKSRILRSCSTLIEIFLALRASSIDFISFTNSSLFLSINVCIVNRLKSNELLIFQRKVKVFSILSLSTSSSDTFFHAELWSSSIDTSKTFNARSFSNANTKTCFCLTILTLDYYKDYYKYE